VSIDLFEIRLQRLVHSTADLIADSPDLRHLLPTAPRPRRLMRRSRLAIAAAAALVFGGLGTAWVLSPEPSPTTEPPALSCPTITHWSARPTPDQTAPLVDFVPTSGLVCAYKPVPTGSDMVAYQWQRVIPTEQLMPILNRFNSLLATPEQAIETCAAIAVTHFVVILRDDHDVTFTYTGPCGYAGIYHSLMALSGT
jgi:hypothetical protein